MHLPVKKRCCTTFFSDFVGVSGVFAIIMRRNSADIMSRTFKKENSLMNLKLLIIYGMVMSCTMAILACSDSNGSFVSNVNSIGENFIGEKDPIVLDEINHTMTIYRFKSENRCVVEDDKYEFVVHRDTSQVYREYKFLGDTLVLLYKDGDNTYGQVLVGGKGGQIKSKWKMTACHYIHKNNSVDCSGLINTDEVIKGSIVYFDITQDTLYMSRIDSKGNAIDINTPEIDEFNDYTASRYMSIIFHSIDAVLQFSDWYGGLAFYTYPWPWSDVFNFCNCDIEKEALQRNITVTSREKNKISFIANNKNVEMEFTHALHLLYSRGQYAEIDVTVKTNEGVCTLNYVHDPNMIPEVCNAENSSSLEIATYSNHDNTVIFSGAKDYHIGDEEKFRSCIVGLVRR